MRGIYKNEQREGRRRAPVDLEGIVDKFAGPMLAMAYRYTFDWEAAKDLCQDTWLRICGKLGIYDGRVPFERWLYAVHRNICLSYLRRKKDTVPDIDKLESRETSPLRNTELSRKRERILRAATDLPARQRTVFAMVDLEQMTIDEVAELLEIKPVSVRTNLHHARRRIAKSLMDSEEKR